MIWDLARLLQTSALLSDLEGHVDSSLQARDPREVENRLQWVCTEPVLVMKVWSRLYNLRFNGGYAERSQTLAPQDIYEDCMYILHNMQTLVLLIRQDLAQKYIEYLLCIDDAGSYRTLLATNPRAKTMMLNSVELKNYRQAVGIYLLAQIAENEVTQKRIIWTA